MDLGYLLMSVSKKVKYQVNKELIKEGVTIQQWAVIKNIGLMSKTQLVTSADLAKQIDIDKATISGILRRLIDKNIVDKKVNPLDKRASRLKLTDSGKKTYNRYSIIADKALAESIKVLSNDEKELLGQILTKLNDQTSQ